MKNIQDSEPEKLTQRGGVLGRALLLFILKKFGRWSVLSVIPFIVCYNILVQPKIRKNLFLYWKTQKPGSHGFKILCLIFKHYFSFGVSLLDRLSLKPAQIHLGNQSVIEEAQKKDRGIILLASHFGGYGLYHFFPLPIHKPLSVIMYIPKEKKTLASTFYDSRFRFIDPSKKESIIFEALEVLKQKELLLMMGDRVEKASRRYQEFPVSGMSLKLPEGPWNFAQSADALVIPVFIVKRQKKYEVRVFSPIEVADSEAPHEKKAFRRNAMEIYSKALESLIQEAPFQWYNFPSPIQIQGDKK